MANFKKNIMILLIWLILCLIIISISAILVYFKLINVTPNSLYIFLCGLIVFLLLGFLSGNIKGNKGLHSGITFSVFILIILLLIQFLGFETKFSLSIFTKYVIFLLTGGLGGILGVNFKPMVN